MCSWGGDSFDSPPDYTTGITGGLEFSRACINLSIFDTLHLHLMVVER